MLFAIEGGGFFSSSASGYSSGLALLLLGRKNDEKQMKISPWNQYQLVHHDQQQFQLAAIENQVSKGCSAVSCFGCGSTGPFDQSKASAKKSSAVNKVSSNSSVGEFQNQWLKSSLKKPSTNYCVLVDEVDGARDSVEEVRSDTSCFAERRKVQWTDTCGKELAEIREFELSDDGISGDELVQKSARRCECVIQ